MKRFLLILLIGALLVVLTGCVSEKKIVDQYGQEHQVFGNLVIIEEIDGGYGIQFSEDSLLFNRYLAYDPDTKAVYMILAGCRRFGITPYLIPDENGEMTYAIFGKNYPE